MAPKRPVTNDLSAPSVPRRSKRLAKSDVLSAERNKDSPNATPDASDIDDSNATLNASDNDDSSTTLDASDIDDSNPILDTSNTSDTEDIIEEDITEEDVIKEEHIANIRTEQVEIMLQEMGLPSDVFHPERRTNWLSILLQISSARDTTKQAIRDFAKR